MKPSFPLITTGIVVLNREWIIDKMLAYLQCQTYPHDRIFVLVVDGESEDRTVEIARKILEQSDFNGYDIIVKKCSIPEGRNICIENMKGDMLLFWDSDIVMEQNAMQELFRTIENEEADIVTADAYFIFANSIGEAEARINEEMKLQVRKSCVKRVPAAGMGHTLILRKVFDHIQFDPDLTICEDLDFSVRAREKGFKIVMNKKIKVLDINIIKKSHSDIHIDMPLKNAIRGIKKKSKAQVLGCSSTMTFREAIKFFLENKRYIFYLGYVPTIILLIWGVYLKNLFLSIIFPLYLLFFTFWQLKRRGFRKAPKAVVRSFLVGVPTSLWLLYYSAKYTSRKEQ